MSADNNATGQSSGLSWDTATKDAPERPSFVSSLPEEDLVDRPRRIVVGFILVIMSIIAFIVVTATAALRFDEIRDVMITALPDDLKTDYSDADIQRAVQVMFAFVSGLGLVLALVLVLSARSLMAKRSSSARAVLIVSTVLYLLIAFVALVVRDSGVFDVILSGTATMCLLTAVVLVCTPAASQWLRQNEQRRSIPFVSPAKNVE